MITRQNLHSLILHLFLLNNVDELVHYLGQPHVDPIPGNSMGRFIELIPQLHSSFTYGLGKPAFYERLELFVGCDEA